MVNIQQSTSNICIKYFARIIIFNLVKTALRAPVTQALPFLFCHFKQGFMFPKWTIFFAHEFDLRFMLDGAWPESYETVPGKMFAMNLTTSVIASVDPGAR